MGLIGSGMCLSDVTCPQPPAEHPLSRITRTAVLLSLVRAPALPPRHAYFGSQSHTPYDRCLRFGPRVAATPARLAPVLPAQLWTDQTCTGKLIPAFLSHPAPGSCRRSDATGIRGLGGPSSSGPWAQAVGDMPGPALCPGHALVLALPSTGRLPSTLSAPDPSAGVVRGFIGTLQPSDSSDLPVRLRLLAFPNRPGTALAAAGGRRSPRFRHDP